MASNPKPERGDLLFDCNFESGNIGQVERTDEFEWSISIREDTNNPKYRIWFYFRITNVKRNQRVLLHFHNYSKKKALFREGFTPIVRSSSRWRWQRLPTRQLFYCKCARHKFQYCFTIAFMFDRVHDEYFFAYSYPYTYTDLQRYLFNLDRLNLKYYRRELLCKTVQKRRLDLLCISSKHILDRFPMHRYTSTQNDNIMNFLQKLSHSHFDGDIASFLDGSKVTEDSGHSDLLKSINAEVLDQTWFMEEDDKAEAKAEVEVESDTKAANDNGDDIENIPKIKVVVITARVHPGESPASYVCHGMINFLLSNDPAARCLRDHAIFYIIPMLNPDGVFLGNHRCSSLGFDLNRHWLEPGRWSQPSIARVKNFLMNLAGDPLVDLGMFIDVHAHTTALAGFMYLNSDQDDGNSNQDEFPKLLDTYCPHFSYEKCKANKHSKKAGTGRRAMGDFLSVVNTLCYTLEVSYFCRVINGTPSEAYTEETYKGIGRNAAFTFMALYKLMPLLKCYKASKSFRIDIYQKKSSHAQDTTDANDKRRRY